MHARNARPHQWFKGVETACVTLAVSHFTFSWKCASGDHLLRSNQQKCLCCNSLTLQNLIDKSRSCIAARRLMFALIQEAPAANLVHAHATHVQYPAGSAYMVAARWLPCIWALTFFACAPLCASAPPPCTHALHRRMQQSSACSRCRKAYSAFALRCREGSLRNASARRCQQRHSDRVYWVLRRVRKQKLASASALLHCSCALVRDQSRFLPVSHSWCLFLTSEVVLLSH